MRRDRGKGQDVSAPSREGGRLDSRESLLQAAAAPILRRLQEDQGRVPRSLRPLLGRIREDLFRASFDATTLKRSCGVRSHRMPARFRQALGQSPAEYIEGARLETAERLLSGTALRAFEIARLVGYRSSGAFSRAFARRKGRSPSQFRQASAADGASAGARALTVDSLRKAISGNLDEAQGRLVMEGLITLYGSANDSPESEGGDGASVLTVYGLERVKAQGVWEQLAGRPLEESRELLQHHLRFQTPALFYLILEEQRRQDPDSDRRRVLGELALASLRAVSPLPTDERQRLEGLISDA